VDRWLVPGLIDAHVHFNDARDAILYVANGVTTVRNMWGNPETVALRGRAKTDPAWIGPSIVTAGPIVDGEPPIWPGSSVVTTPAQAAQEVADHVKDGYDFVKVYENLTPEAYAALRDAAKQHGLRLAGHAPRRVAFADVLAGQASIEHLTGYLMAAQDATSKAATVSEAARFAELLAHVDEAKLTALAADTAKAGIANCPTMVVLERIAGLDQYDAMLARPENKYVTAMTLASWDPKNDFRFRDSGNERFATMREANVVRNKLVKMLHAAGATILAGTDTGNPFVVAGFALHDELALLVAAGLTPYQALRAATAVPAEHLGVPAGTVRAGARADLVLLTADPLRDITATTRRAGTMLRGRWYPQAALDDKLAALVGGGDPFAGLAPPAIAAADGETIFAATYTWSMGGRPAGKERVAIGQGKDGRRVIVAQGATEVASTVRVELDAAGKLTSLAHEAGGTRTRATLAGGTLTFDGASEPAAADLLLDTDLVATMIPFAARAAPGTKTTVAGRSFPRKGDVTYVFDRTGGGTTWPFSATSSFGTATGTYVVDDQGFPVTITLQTGFGEFVAKKD
jgi:imidazolonepropionase-like amidohydrolase